MNLLGSLGKMATQAAQKFKEEITGESTPTQTQKGSTPAPADKSEVDFYRDKVGTLEQQIRQLADKEAQLSKQIQQLKAENQEICNSYSALDEAKNNEEVLLKKHIKELEGRLKEGQRQPTAEPTDLEQLKKQVDGLFRSRFEGIVVHVMEAIQQRLDSEVGEPVDVELPQLAVIAHEDVDRIVAELNSAKGNTTDMAKFEEEIARLRQSCKSLSVEKQSSDAEVARLTLALEQAAQQSAANRANLQAFDSANAQLQEKINYLESYNNDLSESTTEMRRKLEMLEGDLTRSHNALEDMEMEYRRKLTRQSEALAEYEELNKVLTLQLREVTESTKVNDETVKKQLNELVSLNQQYQQEITKLNSDIQVQETTAQEQIKKHEEHAVQQRHALEQLQQTLLQRGQTAESSAKATQSRVDELQSTVDQLESQLLDALASSQRTSTELRELRELKELNAKQKASHNEELTALRMELEEKSRKIGTDLQAITALENSLLNSRQTTRQTEEELKRLQATSSKQDLLVKSLKKNQVALERFIETSMHSFEQTGNDVEQLLECYEEELEELRTAYQPFCVTPLFNENPNPQPVPNDLARQLQIAKDGNRGLRMDLANRQRVISCLQVELKDLKNNPRIVRIKETKDAALQAQNQRLKQETDTLRQTLSAANHSTQTNQLHSQMQLELKGEISQLRSQLNEQEAEKRQLTDRLQQLQTQLSTVQMQLQTANSSLSQNLNQIHELQNNLSQRQTTDAEAIERFERETSVLRERNQQAELIIAEMSARHQQENTKLRQLLQRQAEEFNLKLNEYNTQLNQAKQLADDLEENRASLQQDLYTAEQHDEAQQQRISQLTQQIAQLQQYIRELQSSAQERAAASTNELQRTQQVCRQFEEQLRSTNNRLREYQSLIQQQTMVSAQLESKLQSSEDRLKTVIKNNMKTSTDSRHEIERLTLHARELQRRQEEYNKELQRLNSSLENANIYESKLQTAEKREQLMNIEVNDLKQRLLQTQMLLEQRTNELQKTDGQLEDLEALRIELAGWKQIDIKFEQAFHRRLTEHNLVEITAKWAAAKEKYAELERGFIETRDKLTFTTEELKLKSESLLRINQELAATMRDNDELKKQLEDAMQINSDTEELKAVLEKENATLKSYQEKEVEALRRNLEQSEAKLKEALQKDLTAELERTKQEESEKLRKALAEKQQEHERAVVEMKQQANDMENSIRRQLRAKEGEVEKLLHELDKLKFESGKVKTALEDERAAHHMEFIKQKNNHDQQTAKLTARVAELQANCDKISLTLAQKDSAINQKAQEVIAKSNELAVLTKEKQALSAKLESLSADFGRYQDLQIHCNTLNQKLILKDEEIQNTLGKLNALSSTITSLEEGIETSQRFADANAAENERLNDLVETMREQLASADRERQRLTKDLTTKDKELNRMTTSSELQTKASLKSPTTRNGHESIDLIVIKNIFIKYFDVQSSLTDRLHTLDTLCSVLQISEREREHLQLYRKRIIEKETLSERKEEKARQNKPIQEKLFSFFSNQADEE